MSGPFTLAEARRAGLTRRQLDGACWRRVGPGTYAWAGAGDGWRLRLAEARLRLPPESAFSGATAAWLHGLDVTPCDPVEVTVADDGGVSARAGLSVRRARLDEGDVVVRRGVPATSLPRTLCDLSARLGLVEAVVAVDMALHEGLTTLGELAAWARSRAGRKGVARLRRVLEMAEPKSESAMETRLRMLLVLAGLPRPEAQVTLHDALGRFLGRLDLYYPAQRLGLEYDGGTHRDSLVADDRRQNRLQGAGVRLLRFTAADMRGTTHAIVAQVSALLEHPNVHSPANRRLAGAPAVHPPANARFAVG